MNRSISHLVLVVVITIGSLGALAGLSAGLWSLLDGSTTGSFILRGLIFLAVLMLVSAISGFFLARSLTKPLKSVTESISDLSSGKIPNLHTQNGPYEISQVLDSLHKLGEKLEQDRKDFEVKSREHSREVRTEALLRLSRGIAREVQNPLAGLIGFAEMALKQPQIDGQLKNYLTLIDQEARAGRQSLERVLRFIQNDDFPTEPIDPNRLLVDASQSIGSTMGDKIRLKMNLADGLPRIMGDPGQLSKVLSILIQNAKEAIGEDGDIEMSSTMDQSGNIVIMIRDTGCGIAKELQEKVFTPFFTTKGNIRGAGLNLAMAASIIRNHGGKLEFFSKEKEGTTFFVKLPVEKNQL